MFAVACWSEFLNWEIFHQEKRFCYMHIVEYVFEIFSSVQFSSVAHSCPTLCNPMNHSTPGLPVPHQLLEFTQTHAHRVGDVIQPSHPLSPHFFSCPQSFPASGSFPMSWLFASGDQSIEALHHSANCFSCFFFFFHSTQCFVGL